MPFPWGALVGLAGTGLSAGLGAALGSDNSNWKHYKNRILATVEDAKRAGIHPLAALGASGLGGEYGSTPITWGDSIGQGMQAAGSMMDDYMQQDADRVDRERQYSRAAEQEGYNRRRDAYEAGRARQNDDLQRRFTEAQIMNLNAQSRSMLAQARAGATGGPGGSARIGAMTDFSADAQDVENWYDNLVSGAYGTLRFGKDAYDKYMFHIPGLDWDHPFGSVPGVSGPGVEMFRNRYQRR